MPDQMLVKRWLVALKRLTPINEPTYRLPKASAAMLNGVITPVASVRTKAPEVTLRMASSATLRTTEPMKSPTYIMPDESKHSEFRKLN